MDKEEFEAWKTSQSTQWVLARLAERSKAISDALKEYLSNATITTPPAEWSGLQSRGAFDRGYMAGLDFAVELEFEEIDGDQ
jgi:hypothetical protein